MARRQRAVIDDNANDASAYERALLRQLLIIARSLGLLALRLSPRRPKTDRERIRILGDLGFERQDIAAILDISPQTVSNRLSEHRSNRQGKRSRRGKN